MAATPFQKFRVDYNQTADVPLDYTQMSTGGFEGVAFRPEEGLDLVSQRMDYCKKQMTFRGQPFDHNIWFADPLSTDSIAAKIPSSAQAWANYIVKFVKDLTVKGYPPKVLGLNIEFTGKGYPPWKSNIAYQPWAHVFASAVDPMDNRVKNFLYVTPNGGQSGLSTPRWQATGVITDNNIKWQVDGNQKQPYQYANGWAFNEIAANTIFNALPNQLVDVQPMGGQGDFNHGIWMKRGARNSPQCYGSQPYLDLRNLEDEIAGIVNNMYIRPYYGFTPDRRRIHPTIGAFGQGRFYVPWIEQARRRNIFGIRIYPHNNLAPSDFTDYRPLVIP